MPILLPGLLALHLQRDLVSERLASLRCFVLRHKQVPREAGNRNTEGNTFNKKKKSEYIQLKKNLIRTLHSDLWQLAGSSGKKERC